VIIPFSIKLGVYSNVKRYLIRVLKMLIGELAEKTGVSTDTIRFYEKEGLIDATAFNRDK
jgi:MerR family regulatory protein